MKCVLLFSTNSVLSVLMFLDSVICDLTQSHYQTCWQSIV